MNRLLILVLLILARLMISGDPQEPDFDSCQLESVGSLSTGESIGMTSCMSLIADDLVGIVTDMNGVPLSGARIDISTAGPKIGRGLFCPSCYLDCSKWAKTNASGRFKIESVDPSLKFHLLATAPGMKTLQTAWIDPAFDTIKIQLEDFPEVDEDHLLLGQVVDANGVPVPGALISPSGAKTIDRRWRGNVDGASSAVSDDLGQFRMLLTEAYQSIDIEVLADGSSGLIVEGLVPGKTVHEVKVPSGTTVTGQLIADGQSAANQPVSVVQMHRGGDGIFLKALLTYTDNEGKFEIRHLPANEPYVVFTPRAVPSTGLCVRTSIFHAKEDGATLDLGTLPLNPGFKLAGRLVSTEPGELPSGTIKFGRELAWDLIEVPIDSDGHFEVDNLPLESFRIGFGDREWVIDESVANFHLVSVREIAWGLKQDTTDIEIPVRKLGDGEIPPRPIAPAQGQQLDTGNQRLSGHVVDRTGKPVAGVRVTPKRSAFSRTFKNVRPARSGADGSFSFSGLPDEELVITFYHSDIRGFETSPGLVSIRYMGQFRTKLNQTDMQIVYDPDVFIEVPELKPRD